MDWRRGGEFTRQNEGLRLTAYQDTRGVWTVGYGFTGNLTIDGEPVEAGLVLTQTQADEEFDNRYSYAYRAAMFDAGAVVFQNLNDPREAALVDMAYNLGRAGLSGFHQFLGYVALGDWANAEDAGYASKWALQVPNRAGRVLAMIATGIWPADLA